MLRIEYFDKNRFMKQVAASRGSVILHLDNCLLYTSPSPRD